MWQEQNPAYDGTYPTYFQCVQWGSGSDVNQSLYFGILILIGQKLNSYFSVTENSQNIIIFKINPIQPSLFEKWFSDFFDALKDHLQMQLKLSILF